MGDRTNAMTMPWTRQVIALWVAATALAGIVLISAWYTAAGRSSFQAQQAPFNAGVAAVIVANISGASGVVIGRRAIGRRRHTLLGGGPDVFAGPVSAEVPVEPAGLVAGAELQHFHRVGCPMTRGREWVQDVTPRQIHERESRRPCGVCQP
jgi:hypothetical protein